MIRRWGLFGGIALISVFVGRCLNMGAFANNLTYQTRVPVEFTFNDTLNLTVSGDLVIPELSPGTFMDSNVITVTVNTNNAYGYTLSATVGDTSNPSREMRHSGFAILGDPIFSNLAIGANLTREVFSSNSSYDNYWGFSTNKVGSAYGGKYNGLPLYNDLTAEPVVLDSLDYMPDGGSSVTDFWIGAKASANKEAGVYTNVINFIAVGGVAPIGLEDAYAAAGKTKISVNGKRYYRMQDMNSGICAVVELLDSSIQAVDIRDNKVYWITKLRDGKCWMTQNLDLDLDSSVTYTHADTDLGWGSDTATTSWTPANATIKLNADGKTFSSLGTTDADNNVPKSLDVGDYYYAGFDGTNLLPSVTTNYLTIAKDSNGDVINSNNNRVYFSIDPNRVNGGTHEHLGNYYNWSAAVASNDTSGYTSSTYDNIDNNPQNSICPAGWRLPTISLEGPSYTEVETKNELARLVYLYNGDSYEINSSAKLEPSPLFFARGGYVERDRLRFTGNYGYYWSSTVSDSSNAALLYFSNTVVRPSINGDRYFGRSVRCVAR